ncbi:ABC transporter permease [Clostridium oryzae]|uniref:FtsX-like permease family protein n=1 Tax=Clostridium oryzae TaxID=1450648 RepID=A0A1V4IF30_9CLOT|nr:FtsX-like permease family protein [Clostridium oryzae]OPJ58563.1 FtsX-like permease family protein [Clostridium oryzae]
MVINHKIKRTMLESKSQYLGSLMLIIISCMLYTMFNQLAINMKTLTSSFEKNYVQEDASFISDKKLTGVAALEKKFNMVIEETGSFDYNTSDNKTLRVFTENTKINIPAVVKGKTLTDDNIMIDPAYASVNNIHIGDSIKINHKEFTISGFMSLPDYIYPLKQESDLLNDPKHFGIAVISKKDFRDLKSASPSYAIKFKGSKSKVDDKIAEFKKYLKGQNIVVLKWTNIDENPRVTYVTAKIDSISSVSSTLPIFILLLTCTLTGIVMWRLLKKEFISIGTLYALGYKKKEIMKHYLAYPLVIAIAGGIIGTLLGAVTLTPMLKLMVSYFNIPVAEINFNALYVLISLLLPIIFLMISGYFIINRALKYSPLDLMRGGKGKNKVGFIEKYLKLDRFKFSTKFKMREQLRSVPRSLFLLVGVSFATMLLLMGFVMKNSIDFMMKEAYENTYKYKYQYLFNSLNQGNPPQGEKFSVSSFALKSDAKTHFTVYGINEDSKYIILKDKTDKNLSTNKVIITKPLAEKLQVKSGDTIYAINKLDSKKYSIKIDSVANTYVGEYIYMPLTNFNSMLNYPTDSYLGLWSKTPVHIDENKLLNTTSMNDFKKAFDSLTKPLQTYVGGISFLAFVIGLMIIYVVTSLIIEENRNSISLMKVLGYRKKEVYSLILNSSSFIVVLGYILGVPLLLVSITALIKSATSSMNLSFPITMNYSSVIIGFIVIYITYEFSKALSKRKVNKISMSEALKAASE